MQKLRNYKVELLTAVVKFYSTDLCISRCIIIINTMVDACELLQRENPNDGKETRRIICVLLNILN